MDARADREGEDLSRRDWLKSAAGAATVAGMTVAGVAL